MRVPCTAWRSSQSILKEINPEYSFEGLMLKVKFQYLGHLLLIGVSSLESWLRVSQLTLMLGKIDGRWRKGGREEDEVVT